MLLEVGGGLVDAAPLLVGEADGGVLQGFLLEVVLAARRLLWLVVVEVQQLHEGLDRVRESRRAGSRSSPACRWPCRRGADPGSSSTLLVGQRSLLAARPGDRLPRCRNRIRPGAGRPRARTCSWGSAGSARAKADRPRRGPPSARRNSRAGSRPRRVAVVGELDEHVAVERDGPREIVVRLLRLLPGSCRAENP